MTDEPYRSKPKMMPARQSNGRVHYLNCHHIFSEGERQGERCFAPTENGKHACPKCLERERTIKNPRVHVSLKSYI